MTQKPNPFFVMHDSSGDDEPECEDQPNEKSPPRRSKKITMEARGLFLEMMEKVSVERLMALTPRALVTQLEKAVEAEKIIAPSFTPRRAAVLFVDISGYTLVADNLKKNFGPADGAERLSRALNGYFTILIQMIQTYGGDVPLFCGDAVMAIWFAETDSEYTAACHSAVSCAATLLQECKSYPIDKDVFSLHLGAACGDVVVMITGGHQTVEHGLLRFLITGAPMLQAAKGVAHALKNEFAIHSTLVAIGATPFNLETQPIAPVADGYHLYISHKGKAVQKQLPSPTLKRQMAPKMRLAIASFSSEPALRFALKDNSQGELRVVSSVFICFYEISKTLVTMTAPQQFATIQKHYKVVQKKAEKYGGIVNKIFQDDKGVLVLANFGLPGCVHDDDALRSLKFALEVSGDIMKKCGTHAAIGVSRAAVFLGVCGSATRQEYTVLGDSVNVAARQMGYAAGLIKPENVTGSVVCDLDTHKVIAGTVREIDFGAVGQIKVRNKPAPIPVLKPEWRDPSEMEDQAAMIGAIMGSAKRLLCADRCSVFIVNAGQGTMTAHFENGSQVTIPIAAGIAGFVGRTGTTTNIPDAYLDDRFNQSIDKSTGYKTTSMLCMPVKDDELIVAVAQLINKTLENGTVIPFSHVDEDLFETFSGYIAVSLRNFAIRQKLNERGRLSPRAGTNPNQTPRTYGSGPTATRDSSSGISSDDSFHRGSFPAIVRESLGSTEDILFERDTELQRIHKFNADAIGRDNRTPNTLLVMTAEDGHGKSSLLQATMTEFYHKKHPYFLITDGNSKSFMALGDALQEIVNQANVDFHWLIKNVPERLHHDMGAIANIVAIRDLVDTSLDKKASAICEVALFVLDGALGSKWTLVVDDFEMLDAYTAQFVIDAIDHGVPTIITRSETVGKNSRSYPSTPQSTTIKMNPHQGSDSDFDETEGYTDMYTEMSPTHRKTLAASQQRVFQNPATVHVPLYPVSVAAFSARFRVLLKCVDIDAQIAQMVHQKTNGNLGFALDVMRALKQHHQIIITPAKHAQAVDNIDIGAILDSLSSVHAILTREIDSLSMDSNYVLRVCAVMGNSFSVGVVAECCGEYPPIAMTNAHGCIEDLISLGILVEINVPSETTGAPQIPARSRSISVMVPSAGRRLKFVRALMKDAVYNQMLSKEREELHGIVATVYSRHSDIDFWKIAFHLTRGAKIPQAVELLYAAAAAALNRRSFKECLKDLAEATRLVTEYGMTDVGTRHEAEHRLLFVRASCDTLGVDECVTVLLGELETRGQVVPAPHETFAMWWATLKERLPIIRNKTPSPELAELYFLLADNAFVLAQPTCVRLATLRAANYAVPSSELAVRAHHAMSSVTHLVMRNVSAAKAMMRELEADTNRYLATAARHTIITTVSSHMGMEDTVGNNYVSDTAAFFSSSCDVNNAILMGDYRRVFNLLATAFQSLDGEKFTTRLKLMRGFALYYLKPAVGRKEGFEEVGLIVGAGRRYTLHEPTNVMEKWHADVLKQLYALRRGAETEDVAIPDTLIPTPMTTVVLSAYAEYAAGTRRLGALKAAVKALKRHKEVHPLAAVSYHLWAGVAVWHDQKIKSASLEWLAAMTCANDLCGNSPVLDAVRAQLVFSLRGTMSDIDLPGYLTARGLKTVGQSLRKSQEWLRTNALASLALINARHMNVELGVS